MDLHRGISIVVPCRNAADWIGETIASATSQTGVELEIVLVDDGSDDDTVRIAESIAGPSLSVIRQGPLGASHARNAGTRAARGAFIQYLDADDILEADTLRMRLDVLTRTGADVAYCNWVRWERQADGSFASGDVVSRTLADRPEIDLFTDAWWPPGALLYRRTIVERIGLWREDLPVIQDARFLLDAALAGGTFVHVDALGLKYRVHGQSSLSRRDPRAFLDDCFTNASNLQATWERDQTLDDERRRALVKVYAYLARSFFTLDRDRFQLIVDRLLELDPNFLPEQPAAFRALSSVVGYPAAEHIALRWRRLKAMARA